MNAEQQQVLVELQQTYEKEESIEARIENLKKQLQLITYDYYRKAYIILKEIMKLRNFQLEQKKTRYKGKGGKLYGVTNLARENGVIMTRFHISYIFLQDYFSPTTQKLIDEGKLRTSTILAILKRSKAYREWKLQDRIVKKYLDKELLVNEILLMHEQVLTDKYDKKGEISKADKDLLVIYENLADFLKRIRAKENVFSNSSMLKKIINSCERIIKETEQVLKFGKNIK